MSLYPRVQIALQQAGGGAEFVRYLGLVGIAYTIAFLTLYRRRKRIKQLIAETADRESAFSNLHPKLKLTSGPVLVIEPRWSWSSVAVAFGVGIIFAAVGAYVYKLQYPEAPHPPPPMALAPPPPFIPEPTQTNYIVFFEPQSSSIPPGKQKYILDVICKGMMGMPVSRIEINGHDDTYLPTNQSLILSNDRADAVAAALIKCGAPADMIYSTAHGHRRLLVRTLQGVPEPQNRRVEVVVWHSGRN